MAELIGKILACVTFLIFGYFVPRIKNLFDIYIDKAEQEELIAIIDSFVRASEQLFKETDEDGTIRNNFVRQCLKECGYEITSEIITLIEGAVFNVNREQKNA